MAEGVLSQLIARFLKVPPEPEPPRGSPGSLRVFNAAPGYYHYRIVTWALKQVGTLIGLVVGLAFLGMGVEFGPLSFGDRFWSVIELAGIGLFVLQIPVSFLMVRLDYRYRWYMTTDTTLRIREGVTSVRERTMTYANIQNLSLEQGPIQRLFGISDLQVRTAGGGGADSSEDRKRGQSEADNMHLGYFRGVDNADEIRDLILGKMRSLKDTGLGDPDEAIAARTSGAKGDKGELLAAASELRAEATALRAAVKA